MQGNVDVRLRPLKIAFLVDPSDEKAILEAIQVNGFLWGGPYNPIIPVTKRVPALWKKSDWRYTAAAITQGYIDAFDPDFYVVLGCDVSHLNLDSQRIISARKILSSVEQDGTPNYGVGLYELLNHFINKELKFVRKEPISFHFINPAKESRLFLASVFGALPKEIDEAFRENFRSSLDATETTVDLNSFASLLEPETMFLRRVTSLYVKATPSAGGSKGSCIFFMDADSTYDILDYWNLRAMGWTVIPVPKQSATADATKRLARDFIDEHFGVSRHNPKFFYNTTILKSRSVSEAELKAFIQGLEIPPPSDPHEYKYVIQGWYPRMWNEWARYKDGVGGCVLEADERSESFNDENEGLALKTLDPKFISRFGGSGEPRFANVLRFSTYGGKELRAQVIPPAKGWDMVRAIDGLEPNTWRFSHKEMVYLPSHSEWTIRLSVPSGKEVFSAWLKSLGWDVELSSPGKIATQMFRQLGGGHGLSILAHEGLLEVLKKMENGKTVSKDEFFSKLSSAGSHRRFFAEQTRLAERLIASGMIRLGIELQCPTCQKRTWVSIKEADYTIQCRACLESFSFPCASLDKVEWKYKTFGPFSLPRRAEGVYSVLLLLRFFSGPLLDCPNTPMLSFVAKKGSKEMEVDLAVYLQEKRFGVDDAKLIFAECKTEVDFKRDDVRKMKAIAEEFPGAIIVFATLKKELSEKEKKLITPLVNRGRRYWKADRPYNPVLILTAKELLSDFGPPECWSEDPALKKYVDQYRRAWKDLVQLCDITQPMYLGMKPWNEWLDERRVQKRRRIRTKTSP